MDFNSSLTSSVFNMSIGTESPIINNNQAGGFLWSNTNDQKVLDAAKDRKYDIVSFMVQNKMVNNYDTVDKDNCTLLHYLARDYELNSGCGHLADAILSGGNVGNFINKQNKDGDTALHVAVKHGNSDMAAKLDAAGCDLTIKNKDGLKIEAETEIEYGSMRGGSIIDTVTDVVNRFLMPTRQDEYTFTENMALSANFMNEYSARNLSVDTDNFLDEIFGQQLQAGGAKKSKKKVTRGKRSLKKTKRAKKRSSTRSTELSRLINSQGSEIHKKVLEKIMTLMKLDKEKQEDVETARNYKAVLWSQVKKNDALKSNLDKSVELEKITSMINLKKIDPKKGLKLREESKKAKEKRITVKKSSNKKTTNTVSATSSDKVSNGGNFSETSYSNF